MRYVFIKSDGGTGQASLRLVSLLRQYCKRLVALVPLECVGGKTRKSFLHVSGNPPAFFSSRA